MFRPAHCSLYTLCPQEREREKLIPLFSFSLQQGEGLSLTGPSPPNTLLAVTCDSD